MANYSIVVITENEESNIRFCIKSCVKCTDDVWVVDSFSIDKTVEISKKHGAKIVQHKFDSWGEQRNYALNYLDLKYDFVLFLDADEKIDERFSQELKDKIEDGKFVAFNVNFDIVFLGKILKYSYDNPPILRVIKKGSGWWTSEGAREHCVVRGPVGKIKTRIRHEDRRGIFFWLTKQIRNADREANVVKKGIYNDALKDEKIERYFRLVLRRIYNKLPRIIRPFIVFIYRYFFRLGFLDGYPGLIFALLHGFWYNLIIDVRIYESRFGYDNYLPVYGGEKTQML